MTGIASSSQQFTNLPSPMKIWLHRISHNGYASYPLLNLGYLSIGFSDFSNPDFLNKVTNLLDSEVWNYVNAEFQKEWGSIPKTRHNLVRFLRDIKAGDWVLVPKQGTFSIYEVSDDHPFCIREIDPTGLRAWGLPDGSPLKLTEHGLERDGNDKEPDLGFARNVRRIHTHERDISRAKFADAALTARMKIRSTTADISDLRENITRSLKRFNEDRPINLHATLFDLHAETTLEAIRDDLDPDKLESLIRWYLEKAGGKAVIPAKNESGKEGDGDIVAVFEAIKTIIYVQAKKHDGETDDWAVQQIVAYRDQKQKGVNDSESIDDGYARIAWVISTAESFSSECIALAKDNNVLLINGPDFVKMLLNAGIEGLDVAL